MLNYQKKYFKYKQKYINRKNILYGGFNIIEDITMRYDGKKLLYYNTKKTNPDDLLKYIESYDKELDIDSIFEELNSKKLNEAQQQIVRNCKSIDYINIDNYNNIYGLHNVIKLKKNIQIIYLLGEKHMTSNIQPSVGTITEYQFIQQILKNSPVFIDFFIEQDIMHKKEKKNTTLPDDQYMRDPARFQAELFKMSLFECKSFPNVRCHFIDPRPCILNADNNIEDRECKIASESFCQNEEDKQKELCKIYNLLKDIMPSYAKTIKERVVDNLYYNNITNLFPNNKSDDDKSDDENTLFKTDLETEDTIFKCELLTFLTKFYLGDFIEELEYSKLIKTAFKKRDDHIYIKEKIIIFIEYLFKELIEQLKKKNSSKIIDSKLKLNNICYTIFKYSINYTLDIYLILRLFKTLDRYTDTEFRKDGPLEMNNIIIHAGNHHIIHLRYFYLKILEYSLDFEISEIDKKGLLNTKFLPFFIESNNYINILCDDYIKDIKSCLDKVKQFKQTEYTIYYFINGFLQSKN